MERLNLSVSFPFFYLSMSAMKLSIFLSPPAFLLFYILSAWHVFYTYHFSFLLWSFIVSYSSECLLFWIMKWQIYSQILQFIQSFCSTLLLHLLVLFSSNFISIFSLVFYCLIKIYRFILTWYYIIFLYFFYDNLVMIRKYFCNYL